MKIGYLKNASNGAYDEFQGEIRTLQHHFVIRVIPEQNKTKDQAPDYKIYATTDTGELTEIGSAWRKVKTRPGLPDVTFFSITIDDPSLTSSLNVAAFKNQEGGMDIVWRRRHPSGNVA